MRTVLARLLFVSLFVCTAAAAAVADECPPNSGNVSCCINRDGTGCGRSQIVSWKKDTGGDWKSVKRYCSPDNVNWCRDNMRGSSAHLVNSICDFPATGYDKNGWSSGDRRCCGLSKGGC